MNPSPGMRLPLLMASIFVLALSVVAQQTTSAKNSVKESTPKRQDATSTPGQKQSSQQAPPVVFKDIDEILTITAQVRVPVAPSADVEENHVIANVQRFAESINTTQQNRTNVGSSIKNLPNGARVLVFEGPLPSGSPLNLDELNSVAGFLNLTQPPKPGLLLQLAPSLASNQAIHVSLYLTNGTSVDLSTEGPSENESPRWYMGPDDPPIALLTIRYDLGKKGCTREVSDDDAANPSCLEQYVIVRNTQTNEAVIGMQILNHHLMVRRGIINSDPNSTFAVNGIPLDPFWGPLSFSLGPDAWRIEWHRKLDGCRYHALNPGDSAAVIVQAPRTSSGLLEDIRFNGIEVGAAKLFDANTLRRMLSDTATQLAAISGFNSASINAASGNLQGITRDTSFFAGQITTTPLPSTVANSSNTGVTIQCPDGSLPTTGSGVTFGCAPVATTSNPVTGSQGTSTTNQTGSTVTSGGQSGTVPSAPAANPLAAPTNIGESSADLLVDQVQLNAQITTLRLLLQGAVSDQYLLRNSRAVSARQQATIGFNVTLDPPRQFRHAVAEVRILLAPQRGQPAVSIMNLLPAEKTYNVAKITSRQDSFGAGVTIAPISAGATVGRSKDRLYLAKDTDTLALQYMPPLSEYDAVDRPWLQKAHDDIKGFAGFLDYKELGDCLLPSDGDPDGTGSVASNSIVFGWQFRPVLGADYVKGGQRQVFAQLALPVGLSEADFRPTIYIQTRWRQYDPKKQVVGSVFRSSCSAVTDPTSVALVTTPIVRNMEETDLGSGQIQLTATGDFYSSTLSVLEGSTVLTPTLFDGSKIEIFGNAHDLLEAGGLTLLGSNGQSLPFGIKTNPSLREQKSCGIQSSKLTAIPTPDGNSLMKLRLEMGPGYNLDPDHGDGIPRPLVLIGSQVFGLKETPFIKHKCEIDSTTNKSTCDYEFVAPTTAARNAQEFIASDLRWDKFSTKGEINFFPMFSALSSVSTVDMTDKTKQDNAKDPKKQPSPKKVSVSIFSLTGFDFDKFPHPVSPCTPKCPTCSLEKPCLDLYIGPYKISDFDLKFQTKTTATLALKGVDSSGKLTFTGPDSIGILTLDQFNQSDPAANLAAADVGSSITIKSIRLLLRGSPKLDESSVAWDLPLPKADSTPLAISPAYVHVSDSRKISFIGDQVLTLDTTNIVFEGTKLTATLDTTKKELDVFITTTVTKAEGHKELVATDVKTGKLVPLPVEVLK